MRRYAAWGLGLAVALLALWIMLARSGAFDADLAQVQARYGAPPSRFVDIDGTRMHYRDEGQGPVLVLLHGSRANLEQWDGWVQAMGGRLRIIRFDVLGHGLAGEDARDDYSAARQLALMHGLLDRLGVERAIVGGTSGGATLAVRYAVAHPERVEALLLSTIPLRMPAAPRVSRAERAVSWFHGEVLGSYTTDLFWRNFLRSIYGDPDKVTADMVTRYRLLNTLPGQQQRFERRLALWRSDGGAERDFDLAGRITVPVLLQWGGAGPVLHADMQCGIASAFRAAPTRVIIYPELGHKLVMEDAARTARDALAFLDGAEVGGACGALAAQRGDGLGVNRP
jgi:pimeloyl-ACP methyl ester carboxylesterase